MSKQPVVHDSFVVERVLKAPAARVFEALSNPEVKMRWFTGPAPWKEVERRMDFRVGGHERLHGAFGSELTSVFDATYFDIVPNERVVYTYEMTVNGRKISTSLATFELFAEGDKTRLVLTEQGAYFHDPAVGEYAPNGQNASRLAGTQALMDQLARLFAG